ncbi:hypothetical protein [Aggregatibacter actinomycetemcomitans]|nr:hypothetical protein [Aggregatibacter actinomycetemcomitans]
MTNVVYYFTETNSINAYATAEALNGGVILVVFVYVRMMILC